MDNILRILSIHVNNFASYKELDFDFTSQGLTLLQGATGSGKSTLCDTVTWILFGVTAKGGTVSEVLSWNDDKPCRGSIIVNIHGKEIQILRIRGATKDNDLILWADGKANRGKDLLDTQRLINEKLGINADLYLAGAYLHEFSQTAAFFTTTAKNRRILCEQLADLSLAKVLTSKASSSYNEKDKELDNLNQTLSSLKSNIQVLEQRQRSENNRHANWEEMNSKARMQVEQNYKRWNTAHSTRVEDLRNNKVSFKHQTNCPTCGGPLAAKIIVTNPYDEQLDRELSQDNPYADQLIELDGRTNPHTEAAADYSLEIESEQTKLDINTKKCQELRAEVDELEILKQVINDYRSVSISNTISGIQDSTNALLTRYFDGEISVKFDPAENDKLEVTIYKDGNLASFTQLSKGQRCLLKLCFGISVMQAVQNHNGVKFSQIFLDEATDGLDENMKVKAFKLLESLTLDYESIFLVEHSEALKSQFTNKYNVELVNGYSQIEQI